MLDFTSSFEEDMLDEDIESSQGFSADGDEGFDGHHEEGDDEFEFSSSSEASSLGDIRVFVDNKDDEDEEEDEEELKKKRAMRRRLRKAWSKNKASPSVRARSTKFESVDGDEGDSDGNQLVFSAWKIDEDAELDVEKGRKLSSRSGTGTVTNGRNSGTSSIGKRTRGNTRGTTNSRIDGDRNRERENYRNVTDSDPGQVQYICDVNTVTDRTDDEKESDICFTPTTYCPTTITQFATQTYTVNTSSAITLTQTDYSTTYKNCPFSSWAFTVTQNGNAWTDPNTSATDKIFKIDSKTGKFTISSD